MKTFLPLGFINDPTTLKYCHGHLSLKEIIRILNFVTLHVSNDRPECSLSRSLSRARTRPHTHTHSQQFFKTNCAKLANDLKSKQDRHNTVACSCYHCCHRTKSSLCIVDTHVAVNNTDNECITMVTKQCFF